MPKNPRSDVARLPRRDPLSPLVRWLLVGPIIGFFLSHALINFRADRPMLGGLYALGVFAWLGMMLILDSRLI